MCWEHHNEKHYNSTCKKKVVLKLSNIYLSIHTLFVLCCHFWETWLYMNWRKMLYSWELLLSSSVSLLPKPKIIPQKHHKKSYIAGYMLQGPATDHIQFVHSIRATSAFIFHLLPMYPQKPCAHAYLSLLLYLCWDLTPVGS